MSDNSEESLTYHLSELRKTILSCIIAITVLFPLGYFAAPYCIDWVVNWSFQGKTVGLNFFSPMEVFITELKIAFVLAFITGFPFIMYKLWQFLLPALYEKEKKFLKLAVLCSSFLFACGVAVCILFILPLVMKFSMSFSTEHIQPVLGLSSFLNLSGWLMLAFGLMFQFPVVIFFLVKFNILSVETLKAKRPYIIVLIFIIAALLTPPDVISQLMLALPTYILFELGILSAALSDKQKK